MSDIYHRIDEVENADPDCPVCKALREQASSSVLQDDLAALLRALGKSDHARSQTPHEVMLECIAEVRALKEGQAIEALEAENAKLREALGIVWVACPKGARDAVKYDYPEIAVLAATEGPSHE